MENNLKHQLFVCTSCASIWKEGKRVGISGGEKLYAQLTADAQNWSLAENYRIRSVECMSACDRACTVGFLAESKFTYLFGDLIKELELREENLPKISAALLECAELYYQKSDGNMAWKERPELLKKGILAKIPPV
jgi:predicted metal-binding protein